MIHRSITVASIPPVMTTVPAVIRPALHQTLTNKHPTSCFTTATLNHAGMCWAVFNSYVQQSCLTPERERKQHMETGDERENINMQNISGLKAAAAVSRRR